MIRGPTSGPGSRFTEMSLGTLWKCKTLQVYAHMHHRMRADIFYWILKWVSTCSPPHPSSTVRIHFFLNVRDNLNLFFSWKHSTTFLYNSIYFYSLTIFVSILKRPTVCTWVTLAQNAIKKLEQQIFNSEEKQWRQKLHIRASAVGRLGLP